MTVNSSANQQVCAQGIEEKNFSSILGWMITVAIYPTFFLGFSNDHKEIGILESTS